MLSALKSYPWESLHLTIRSAHYVQNLRKLAEKLQLVSVKYLYVNSYGAI